MLERIAKAIHASLTDAPSPEVDEEWDRMSEQEQAPYSTAARRVLHVMRWPTDAMLDQGNKGTARDAGNVWEAMIYRAIHD